MPQPLSFVHGLGHFLFIHLHLAIMTIKVDLESIIKKAEIFKCIKHRKTAILKPESGVIIIQACCNNFHDHIECFIERQIELASNEQHQEEI